VPQAKETQDLCGGIIMPFNISVQHDLKKLRRSLTALETQNLPQATVSTLNRLAESTKVANSRHIVPKMNSRQAAVKRRIETRKAQQKCPGPRWCAATVRCSSLSLPCALHDGSGLYQRYTIPPKGEGLTCPWKMNAPQVLEQLS